jgi:hypothetical protein
MPACIQSAVAELRGTIRNRSLEIKQLKLLLTGPIPLRAKHRSGDSKLQSTLAKIRANQRTNMLAYAFLLGKRLKTQEANGHKYVNTDDIARVITEHLNPKFQLTVIMGASIGIDGPASVVFSPLSAAYNSVAHAVEYWKTHESVLVGVQRI